MHRKLSEHLPAEEALSGTAEAIPLPDESDDAVVVAQAFHWFDGHVALAEIHRGLRPDGRLGLIWNARDISVYWVARLTEILEPQRGDVPSYHSGEWREALASSRLFGPLLESHIRNEQRTSPDGVVDRMMSVSFIAALPDAECRGVCELVRGLIDRHPDLADRDEITSPYTTDVFWCDRAP